MGNLGQDSGVSAESEEAVSHLHFEAWEMYKNYVHEAAPDRLPLPPALAEQLRDVVEGPGEGCPARLEAPLLAAYQLVYASLQTEQVSQRQPGMEGKGGEVGWLEVVPFCQSEGYEERLVGARPVLLNIAPLAVPKAPKAIKGPPSLLASAHWSVMKGRGRWCRAGKGGWVHDGQTPEEDHGRIQGIC